jgi:membrane protein DedA with SNARE-associated domain
MESLDALISHYGYLGIFGLLTLGIVGLPVPDETLLLACGALIARGKLEWVAAWASAVAGSMCGISVSYAIGRLAGRGFVHRWGPYVQFTEERQHKVQAWFDRLGHWVLTFGYFILGVRHFTALVAGMSEVRYRTFALYAYPGAVLWVSTFVGLGAYLGDNWKGVLALIHRSLLFLILAGAAVAVIAFLIHRQRRKA